MLKKKYRVLYLLLLILLFISFWHEKRSNNNDKDVFIPLTFKECKIEIEKMRDKKDLNKKYYIINEFKSNFVGYSENKIDDYMMEPFKDDEIFMKIFSNVSHKEGGPLYKFLDNCKFKNCFFTNNNQYYHLSDALVFRNDFYLKYDNQKLKTLMRERKQNQIWIFWNDNLLEHTNKLDFLKFNWSLTYSQNSEIWGFGYGRMFEIKVNDPLIKTKSIIREFRKRSNAATWFINDCPTNSNLKFVNEISNYFPIKVGGNCMKKIYGTKVIYLEENILYGRGSSCERDYMKKNKFHISFETTNCTDYITEKFWHSLSLDTIPVVFQPSKEAYKRLVPEDSFIHAQDFNYNPKLLAQYLDRVSNEKELYLKHLNWKFKFKLHFEGDTTDPNDFKICQLCTKLNQETKSIYYKSIASWHYHKCSDSSLY
jgi:hypothetical protein